MWRNSVIVVIRPGSSRAISRVFMALRMAAILMTEKGYFEESMNFQSLVFYSIDRSTSIWVDNGSVLEPVVFAESIAVYDLHLLDNGGFSRLPWTKKKQFNVFFLDGFTKKLLLLGPKVSLISHIRQGFPIPSRSIFLLAFFRNFWEFDVWNCGFVGQKMYPNPIILLTLRYILGSVT